MKSLFSWPGGKSRLLKTLCARIPAHTLYVEVFAGSAKLLFAKEPSRREVVNDANGEIANFYRVVKHRAADLAEALEHEIIHPERFRQLRVSGPGADELERALRFAYLTWYSFGAKGEHFARLSLPEALTGGRRRPIEHVRSTLEAAAQRLQNVRIEQRDFSDILPRFDSPETFFYLDPPYVHYGNVAQYDHMQPEQRDKLFGILAGLQGSFILSFDDCPEVRERGRQHGFALEEVKTGYSIQAGQSEAMGSRQELLIKKAA